MIAYRKNGKVVIEVSEDALVSGVEQLDPPLRVTDRETYLNFIASQICEFGDNGDFGSASHFTRLLDLLANEALESDAAIIAKEE